MTMKQQYSNSDNPIINKPRRKIIIITESQFRRLADNIINEGWNKNNKGKFSTRG